MPAVLIILVVLIAGAFYFDREETHGDTSDDRKRTHRANMMDHPR